MGNKDVQVQNIAIDFNPNDPGVIRVLVEQIKQMRVTETELRKRIEIIEEKLNN